MSECYLGEIRMVSFNFAPRGWALCNGQTLPINQNQTLFALLGTRFGGNGSTTFNLPDLRGRVPLHAGAGLAAGQGGGEEAHALTSTELPQHLHGLSANSSATTSNSPAGALLGTKGRQGRDMFAAPGDPTSLHPATVSQAGASQPHENMQPWLALNFAIALSGIFPTRN